MRYLIVAVLLLAGCALTEAQRAALDPANTTVAVGEGLLAARVVLNIAEGPVEIAEATLSITPLSGGGQKTLKNKATTGASGALFLEPLPPGRYRLGALVSHMGNITIRAPLAREPDFEIQADRVTDLGALVLAFVSVGLTSGKYVVGRMASPDDTDVVLGMLPPDLSRRLLASPPMRGFQPPDEARGNREKLELAKATADITSQSDMVEGEPIAFGRTLGLVSIWDPRREEWSTLYTGRSFTVRSVGFARDGTLLAGMEEGVLLAHRDGTWKVLPPPAPHASVLFIAQAPSGEFYALVEDRTAIILLSTPDPLSQWTELKRLPVLRFLNDDFDSRAQGALAAGSVAVIYWSGGSNLPVLHRYDLGTKQWHEVQLPHRGPFDILGDGSLVASSGTAYNRALHWSRDWGGTWTNIPLDNWAIRPTFANARTVYLQRTDKGAFSGPAKRVTSIVRSHDAGESWERTGELPAFATHMYALPKPGWLLVSTQGGSWYFTSDAGATWSPRLFLW